MDRRSPAGRGIHTAGSLQPQSQPAFASRDAGDVFRWSYPCHASIARQTARCDLTTPLTSLNRSTSTSTSSFDAGDATCPRQHPRLQHRIDVPTAHHRHYLPGARQAPSPK